MTQIETEATTTPTPGGTTSSMTGSEVVVQTLKAYGIEYAAGIPGHGAWGMLDAFLRPGADIPFIQTFHEQGAVHLADGYFRATGRPMAVFTSVGPGAANTIMGLATAYVDSASLLLFTGSPPTHMVGRGTMQEIDRQRPNDFEALTRPVTKRQFTVDRVDQLPHAIHRGFNAMLTGRPGPVHIEVPMDVQAASAELPIHDLQHRLPVGVGHPDPVAIAQAAALLRAAERPVIVLGGGAMHGDAPAAVRALAEALSIPVVCTWNGKSVFPEDHPLFVGANGYMGTIPANTISATADVVLAVGCRFTDWSASSYRRGATFSIPGSKLIHIDIDAYEIGKTYPAEVGIVADAAAALSALHTEVGGDQAPQVARDEYFGEIAELQASWRRKEDARVNSERFPFTFQRVLHDLREVLPRDGILVVGSGNAQGVVKQSFPFYEPRTHLGSGGYSSMGWAVPAAIGAKLGRPDRAVVCVVGDGDFLMTLEEIAVCAANGIPVVFLVLNNAGYISIRGGQRRLFDRDIASEFTKPDGTEYSPDFAAIARAFGIESRRVENDAELQSTLREALDFSGPILVEIPVSRDGSGPSPDGWWDLPVPAYITDERQEDYWVERAEEQHI